MIEPACLIIGGPNGSGKTTTFKGMSVRGTFVNADDLASAMASSKPSRLRMLDAGKLAVRMIRQFISEGRDFVFETTLSSQHSIKVMQDARKAGFRVGLLFVTLRSPDLNIERIKARVAQGGHAIPEDVARRRYEKSFERLALAIPLAHRIEIRDNSAVASESLLEIDEGDIVHSTLVRGDSYHERIAVAVAYALGLSPESLLHKPETPGSGPA